MRDKIVLLPCPACGADARAEKRATLIWAGGGGASPDRQHTARIKCKRESCGKTGPQFEGDDCVRRAAEHWAALAPLEVTN